MFDEAMLCAVVTKEMVIMPVGKRPVFFIENEGGYRERHTVAMIMNFFRAGGRRAQIIVGIGDNDTDFCNLKKELRLSFDQLLLSREKVTFDSESTSRVITVEYDPE